MKQLFTLLLILPFFLACSSDKEVEPKLDYTSVTIESTREFYKSILAVKENGVFRKIAEIGKIPLYKETESFIIPNDTKEVYIFGLPSDYMARTNKFSIKSMTKNRIEIKDDTELVRIDDTDDPTQYPQ